MFKPFSQSNLQLPAGLFLSLTLVSCAPLQPVREARPEAPADAAAPGAISCEAVGEAAPEAAARPARGKITEFLARLQPPARVPGSALQAPPQSRPVTRFVPEEAAVAPISWSPATSSPEPPDSSASPSGVAELEAEARAAWREAAGEAAARTGKEVPRRDAVLQAASRLIAVKLVQLVAAPPPADGGSPEEPQDSLVEDALHTAAAADGSPQSQVLAAAYLYESGRGEEAADLLEDIERPVPPQEPSRPGRPSRRRTPPAREVFRLTHLAFARGIDGPGEFEPATPEDLQPGKEVLVYGEFENAVSVEDLAEDGSPGFRRSFSASLTLKNGQGEALDSLEFLPEGKGNQVSPRSDDPVNFWACYRLPGKLQAGKYLVVVNATDILGGCTTSATVEFEVSRSATALTRR